MAKIGESGQAHPQAQPISQWVIVRPTMVASGNDFEEIEIGWNTVTMQDKLHNLAGQQRVVALTLVAIMYVAASG